jgi:hypothetical protein
VTRIDVISSVSVTVRCLNLHRALGHRCRSHLDDAKPVTELAQHFDEIHIRQTSGLFDARLNLFGVKSR